MAEMEHNRVKEGMRTAMAPLAEERERLIAAYNAIPYEYTARTMRRIRRLFRMQKVKAFGKTAAQWGKRAAVIVLVLLTLALAACVAIKPLREKLANAFLTWTEISVEVHFEKTAEETVCKFMTYVPEGYECIENKEVNGYQISTYMNDEGIYICFTRKPYHENNYTSYDNSDYTCEKNEIGDLDCVLMRHKEDEQDFMITWTDEGCIYVITAYLPIEELIKIVENVR